jgi:hypothetical protein
MSMSYEPNVEHRRENPTVDPAWFSRMSSTIYRREITSTEGRQTSRRLLIVGGSLIMLALAILTLALALMREGELPPTLPLVLGGAIFAIGVVLTWYSAVLFGRRARAARLRLVAEEERIRTRGKPARATILHTDFTGGEPAENYGVGLEVEVVFEGFRAPSYRVECHTIVPKACIGRLRPLSTVPVVVDPDHADNIRILWDQP